MTKSLFGFFNQKIIKKSLKQIEIEHFEKKYKAIAIEKMPFLVLSLPYRYEQDGARNIGSNQMVGCRLKVELYLMKSRC